MHDTWSERDLPVLEVLVRDLDAGAGISFPDLRDVTDQTDLDLSDATRAALALEGAGYIELTRQGVGEFTGEWYVTSASKEARQAVGQWPSAEQLVDALIERLTTAADEEPDPEQRSRLREAASAASGVARSVFVDVMSGVITRGLGG
ncbi:hypothetical protein [Streptomyces sp. NPDC005548]|uniref:hypothetical protein n=1 Tax=Streptomyces sp. NPDC005548 TaxID=3364724 RepID=UPI0036A38C54